MNNEERTGVEATLNALETASRHHNLRGQEFAAVMQESRERAEKTRRYWITAVSTKERTFDELMLKSMDADNPAEARYVSIIMLYDILRRSQGWDSERAYEAMVSSGIDYKATVYKARVSQPIYDRFSDLLNMDGNDWLPRTERAINRPEMPQGWPWRSKIEDLYELEERCRLEKSADPETGVIEDNENTPAEDATELLPSADTHEGNITREDDESDAQWLLEQMEESSEDEYDEQEEDSYNPFVSNDETEIQTSRTWQPPIKDEEDVDEAPYDDDTNSDGDEGEDNFTGDLMRSLGLDIE